MLTGYLIEWAVLGDKCEVCNSQDTSPLSWDRFYEELARWFGVEKGVVSPEEDESKFAVLEAKSEKETPMGYVYFSLLEISGFVVHPPKTQS